MQTVRMTVTDADSECDGDRCRLTITVTDADCEYDGDIYRQTVRKVTDIVGVKAIKTEKK